MSWTGSRAIVIDHTKVPSDQTNFPIVLATTFSYLKSLGNGGEVQNASGFDIVFASDAAGTTILDFERVSWDPATGKAEFWVKIPTLSSSVDATIYLLSGNAAVTTEQANPAGVWAAYEAVYHLGDGSGLTVDGSDATGVNDATPGNSPLPLLAKIAGGARFGAATSSPNLTAGSDSSINDLAGGNMTVEFWLRLSDPVGGFPVIINKGNWASSADKGWVIWPVRNVGSAPTIQLDVLRPYPNTAHWGADATSFLDWMHVVITYNGGFGSTDALIYIDGALQTTTVFNAGSGTLGSDVGEGLHIGGDPGYGNSSLGGRLDEIRLSRTVQTADYIATCYANQNDPSTFFKSGFPAIPSGLTGSPIVQVDGTNYSRQSSAEQNPFLWQRGSDLYQVTMQTNTAAPQVKTLRVERSTDGGLTWNVVDDANSPDAGTLSGNFWLNIEVDTLSVAYTLNWTVSTSIDLKICRFDLTAGGGGAWGTPSSALNIAGATADWLIRATFYRKSNGDYRFIFNDNANAKLVTYSGTTWGGPTNILVIAAENWGGDKDSSDVGHIYMDSSALKYYQLSAGDVLSAATSIPSAGVVSTNGKRPGHILWGDSTVIAWVTTVGQVKVSIGSPLSGPTFTTYTVKDYSGSATNPVASYATPYIRSDGKLGLAWILVDYSTWPVTDRIVTSTFDGVSSWSTDSTFYEISNRPPSRDLEDFFSQFLHTLAVLQLSTGQLIMATAIEAQINWGSYICTGEVVLGPVSSRSMLPRYVAGFIPGY